MLDIPVRDLGSREPVTVSPADRVGDVARRIAASGTDSAIISVNGQPVGIVTEHDLVHRVLAVGLRADRAPVVDVMSSPVRTLPGDARASDAARLMAMHHVRHIPILDGGRISGVVTDRDLIALAPQLFESAREAGNDRGGRPGFTMGVCESCETLSADLAEVGGALMCEDCRDAARPEDGTAE